MRAIFPLSADPITLGHMDLIERSSSLFEYVFVVLASNPKKKYMFTDEERFNLCQSSCNHLNNVIVVEHTNGAIVDLCKSIQVNVMVRGIRTAADLDHESNLAQTNKLLSPDVETLFMLTRPEHAFVSSSNVRELISLKKYDMLKHYVPKTVEDWIMKRR